MKKDAYVLKRYKMIIDSHCHLHLLTCDISRVISDAYNKGVSHMINVCLESEDLPMLQSISARYPNIFHSYGIHPTNDTSSLIEDDVIIKKCVAIGETGLDYHHKNDEKEKRRQAILFESQLALAKKYNKSVIVHSRKAKDDTISILKKYPDVRGVLHCFTEDLHMAEQAYHMGWMISFSGILTFKNSHLQEIAKKLPMECIMLETDSPYLSPSPIRGTFPNLPENILFIANFLAQLRNISLQEVCEITKQNTIKCFQLLID